MFLMEQYHRWTCRNPPDIGRRSKDMMIIFEILLVKNLCNTDLSAPEVVRLNLYMRRIRNKKPPLCLWFFQKLQSPSTVFGLQYFVSNFSHWFKIVNPCFIISNNLWKLPVIEFGKHFEHLLRCVYSYPLLVICQYMRYPSARNLTCKIRIIMKCIRKNDMRTVFKLALNQRNIWTRDITKFTNIYCLSVWWSDNGEN